MRRNKARPNPRLYNIKGQQLGRVVIPVKKVRKPIIALPINDTALLAQVEAELKSHEGGAGIEEFIKDGKINQDEPI